MNTPKNQEWTCASCSHKWLGPRSTCPACGQIGKSLGTGDFTKKVRDDDSDLRKGF